MSDKITDLIGEANDLLVGRCKELKAENDRLREALTGLLAIDENTEPLLAKTAWIRACAALEGEAGK